MSRRRAPLPPDPMRTRATDSGHADAFEGARDLYVRRERARARAGAHLLGAEVDIGEPRLPVVTLLFLAAAVAMTGWEFATYGASPGVSELSRAGGSGIGAVATGAWWKLLTANLLHGSIAHVLMNAFVIYLTGRWLEHLAGRVVVVTTILWSALLASVGALVVDVAAVTIGASGVAFGLVGCALAVDPKGRTATGVIARQLAVVNVIGTFLIPGISIGGHLGGLVAGLLVGWSCWRWTTSLDQPAGAPRQRVAVTAIAVAVPIAALLAVGPGSLPGEARDLRGSVVAPLLGRQLDGATLTGGLEVDDARCEPTPDPLEYACDVDGREARVRFSRRDDQWGLGFGV